MVDIVVLGLFTFVVVVVAVAVGFGLFDLVFLGVSVQAVIAIPAFGDVGLCLGNPRGRLDLARRRLFTSSSWTGKVQKQSADGPVLAMTLHISILLDLVRRRARRSTGAS